MRNILYLVRSHLGWVYHEFIETWLRLASFGGLHHLGITHLHSSFQL